MLCEIALYGSNVLVSGKQVEISVEQTLRACRVAASLLTIGSD